MLLLTLFYSKPTLQKNPLSNIYGEIQHIEQNSARMLENFTFIFLQGKETVWKEIL